MLENIKKSETTKQTMYAGLSKSGVAGQEKLAANSVLAHVAITSSALMADSLKTALLRHHLLPCGWSDSEVWCDLGLASTIVRVIESYKIYKI